MIRKQPEWAAEVEQGEPTDSGTWYAVELESLLARGYRYVEVHFPDTGDDQVYENGAPDDVRLLREDEV